jgi:hypothetical protein
MDFITSLPLTFHHHDSIWMVVFRFSKMAIFFPCTKTTTATQTSNLFFTHVWTHFGLPSIIIYDHDSCFLNTFWKTLCSLLGCHLKYSTSFHPQTDGKTKVVNRSLVHALCIQFTKSKQWDATLHIVQHSYNRVIHVYIGFSPFKDCFGYHLDAPYELPLKLQHVGTPRQQKEKTFSLSFLKNLDHKQAHIF